MQEGFGLVNQNRVKLFRNNRGNYSSKCLYPVARILNVRRFFIKLTRVFVERLFVSRRLYPRQSDAKSTKFCRINDESQPKSIFDQSANFCPGRRILKQMRENVLRRRE